MAVGAMQIKRYHCRTCGKNMKFERPSMVWGCGDLFLVVLTAGFWALVKILFGILFNPYRCSECGQARR